MQRDMRFEGNDCLTEANTSSMDYEDLFDFAETLGVVVNRDNQSCSASFSDQASIRLALRTDTQQVI